MELMTVMTATNRSPPCCESIALHATCTALDVKPMIKPEMPSEVILPMSFACGRMRFNSKRNSVRLPSRKRTTHTAETSCESTVASAAPCTPMSNTKISSGSSAMFTTAPITTVSMPRFAKPCALMNPFMPSETIMNTLPSM